MIQFSISVKTEPDQYPFDEELGHLSSKWVPGSLRVPRHKLPYTLFDYVVDGYAYYVPETSVKANIQDCIRSGYSKREARKQAAIHLQADLQRYIDYHYDRWYYMQIEVEVSLFGVVLGEAAHGNIESDSLEYIEEIKQELIDEATVTAVHNLILLQAVNILELTQDADS